MYGLYGALIMATTTNNMDNQQTGIRVRVRGMVQGVGFRPVVWRLARQLRLAGHVLNDGDGVLIDIWGEHSSLQVFTRELVSHCPPLARIDSLQQESLSGTPATNFHIVSSKVTETHTNVVADAATCQDCLHDINNPENRRYRYPFTNCTNCGPRLSIIDTVPYDRINTCMADFIQCKSCQGEYENPESRRFHAQPNACPECGPKVWLEPVAHDISGIDDIERAQKLLKQGYIIAIKGIGGFHLACDATHRRAVSRLRERKQRYAKPFALMAGNIGIIHRYGKLTDADRELLSLPSAPIVLVDRKVKCDLAPNVASRQNSLGFMLPYTPLHHLLLQNYDHPIVMTSGNITEDPQCIDNESALSQLESIADYWLLHDRDILHRIDDSVVRVVANQSQILRRARGYAPTPIRLPAGFNHTYQLLAFGGELKNTFCLVKDGQAILSQHMGDLENAATLQDYEKNLSLYQRLFDHQPSVLVVDAHSEYISSKLGRAKAEAEQLGLIEVSHHHAHLAACLAENNWPLDAEKVLGVVLDGLGLGQDGSLWGGEFLLADYCSFEHLGSFKPVALIGAAKAIYEPWRNTFAHLTSAFGWDNIQAEYQELELIEFIKQKPVTSLNAMLDKGINSPLASSCGRLFDAVAAAAGICRDKVSYEGQAAIELEALIDHSMLESESDDAYFFQIHKEIGTPVPYLDPTCMWLALLNDLRAKRKPEVIAARFHLGLVNALFEMIEHLTHEGSNRIIHNIALTGGVFQNRILFEQLKRRLETAKYNVLCHSQVPCNDGGLALGQAVVAYAQLIKEKSLCV